MNAAVLRNYWAGSFFNERQHLRSGSLQKQVGNLQTPSLADNGGVTLSLFQEHP